MKVPEQAIEAATAAIQVRMGPPIGLNDLARAALEAAAPFMLVHVHHHDIENHAASFNEGYERAMAHQVAPDPTTAGDWLEEQLRKAKAEALREAADDLKPGGGYPGYRIQYWLRDRVRQLEAGE